MNSDVLLEISSRTYRLGRDHLKSWNRAICKTRQDPEGARLQAMLKLRDQ
jgi:hypothetical protein